MSNGYIFRVGISHCDVYNIGVRPVKKTKKTKKQNATGKRVKPFVIDNFYGNSPS